jgi:hypothetical protein
LRSSVKVLGLAGLSAIAVSPSTAEVAVARASQMEGSFHE